MKNSFNFSIENIQPLPDHLFGFHPKQFTKPVGPLPDEFCFSNEKLLDQVFWADIPDVVVAPPSVEPPQGRYYPLAPKDGFKLTSDNHYQSGRVYVAAYDVSGDAINAHINNLKCIETPPNVDPEFVNGAFIAELIPGMIQMIPGIPYVFAFNDDPSRQHTVACAHTLDSLKGYDDYADILIAAEKLAKLSWGCKASENSLEIQPIYKIPGLKLNDRADARSDFHTQLYDGSFSLANTVMKGEGLGTTLPAVQANTSAAQSQITQILEVLHSLYQHIMPKSLSKFEYEVLDFHHNYNNVIGFGGLASNGTGCQLNVSSLGRTLAEYIGLVQGGWHADTGDDETRYTLFTLLLRIGPGMFYIC